MDAVNRSRHIAGLGTPASAWAIDPTLADLPFTPLAGIAPAGARVVVVAPHPDDEILACAGLLQLVAARGDAALVVAVTNGEASHPGSSAWPPAQLARQRAHETALALDCLGVEAQVVRLGILDGGVRAAEDDLAQRLAALVAPGDLVVTTWRYDGHPDHEATARAAATACRRRGARLLQAPVWGWHWSAPGDGAIPLRHARKLALPAAAVERKRAALACFISQTTADASTGAAPILPAFAMERLLHPFELYLDEEDHDD